jgi:hypothetical protein
MSEEQDWDDNLEPEQRASVMNATAKAMGLEPRYGNFQAGAQEARQVAYSGIRARARQRRYAG